MIKDLLLEAGRIILIGLLAYLITDQGVSRIVDMFGAHLDASLKLQLVIVLTTIAKAIDRAIHESDNKAKGILPF